MFAKQLKVGGNVPFEGGGLVPTSLGLRLPKIGTNVGSDCSKGCGKVETFLKFR